MDGHAEARHDRQVPAVVRHAHRLRDPGLPVLVQPGQVHGRATLGPDDGSFDDDSVQYRARHICGAATGDPTLTYASDNTGGATEPTGMPTVADVTHSV